MTHPTFQVGERVIVTDGHAVARPGTVLKSTFEHGITATRGWWYKVDTADVHGDLWWPEASLTTAPAPPARAETPPDESGKWT